MILESMLNSRRRRVSDCARWSWRRQRQIASLAKAVRSSVTDARSGPAIAASSGSAYGTRVARTDGREGGSRRGREREYLEADAMLAHEPLEAPERAREGIIALFQLGARRRHPAPLRVEANKLVAPARSLPLARRPRLEGASRAEHALGNGPVPRAYTQGHV